MVGVIAIADVGLYILGSDVKWQELVIGLAMTLATALFTWWPSLATISLLISAVVQAAGGQESGYILYITAVAGLVVYTSPVWFVALYGTFTAATAVFTWATTDTLTNLAVPALCLVGLVSALVGWGLRGAHSRERRLAHDMNALHVARTKELEAERQRISDELHDIVAHDITLVAMHARVLERVEDLSLKEKSVSAIRDSADQALADIRRMLRIVRDHPAQRPEERSESPQPNISSAISDACQKLAVLGTHVTVDVQPGIKVSTSVEKTIVRVVREGGTNIAKHATSLTAQARITLSADSETVRLTITNTSPRQEPCESSPLSSGYGIDRLRERVSLLGGSLRSGPAGDNWELAVQLPLR